MDTTLRQSSSFAKASSVDLSQLDKINAIPNKTSNSILMDNLCQEDQLYLNALMDNDSSEHEDDGDPSRRSTAWSPMIHSPVVMNKRIKKLRPSYAVTLSLEDISYIRPSWGLSKGVRTIEINKDKKHKQLKELASAKSGSEKSSDNSSKFSYHYFLFLIIVLMLLLTIPAYLVDRSKEQSRIDADRIKVIVGSKMVQIYKPTGDLLVEILKLHFGQRIPKDLKPDRCSCEIYTDQTNRYDPDQMVEDKRSCVACLDWAYRANLRVYIEKKRGDESICYNIKWQSYDNLITPLVDCFIWNNGEDWLGLGDVQAPGWPMNRLQFDWTSPVTDLSSEFLHADGSMATRSSSGSRTLPLGSYVNLSLISTNGISFGKINTDFEPILKLSKDPASGLNKLCLSASCTDKCSRNWLRADHYKRFRYHNNKLEYSICSSASIENLMSAQIEDRLRLVVEQSSAGSTKEIELNELVGPTSRGAFLAASLPQKLLERESTVGSKTSAPHQQVANSSSLPQLQSLEPVQSQTTPTTNSVSTNEPIKQVNSPSLPEGIGLIDRAIYAPSVDSLSTLDGQTLRQYVDSIVKLGLKASSILLIDTRWETYVGSLKLNTALFPKAKLLFEILHNRGFKIVFTIKPYIDTGIGINNVNQLFESGRLYAANYLTRESRPAAGLGEAAANQQSSVHLGKLTEADGRNVQQTIIRRQSLLTHRNQTVEIGSNGTAKFPFMFKCRESLEGYCVLIDLTQAQNRDWLIGSIKRSSLLAIEANGIQIGGAHPSGFNWDDHYRNGVSELARSLFYREKLFVLPQWTGDFNYIQLAPRHCTWDELRSVINSVINLGSLGFSLIHPGSVWGDLKWSNSSLPSSASSSSSASLSSASAPPSLVGASLNEFKISDRRMGEIYKNVQPPSERPSDEELVIRWLQVSMFLPILQFSNLSPIERYGLQELVQNLVKIRKVFVVPELKRNLPFTPLISGAQFRGPNTGTLPLIRPILITTPETNQDGAAVMNDPPRFAPEQFAIGSEIVVAPILSEGQRQRDIYLPAGFWRDELRQVNLRGDKWLRDYPIELNEIAWFTRLKR